MPLPAPFDLPMSTAPSSSLPLNDWRVAIERGLPMAPQGSQRLLHLALEAIAWLTRAATDELPHELMSPVDLHEQTVGAQGQGGASTLQHAWTCAGQAFLALGAHVQGQVHPQPSVRVTEGGAIALHLPFDCPADRQRCAVHFHLALAMAKTHPLQLNGRPTGLVLDDVAVTEILEMDHPCGLNLVVQWVPRTVVSQRLPAAQGAWAKIQTWWKHWASQDDDVERLRDACLGTLSRCMEQMRKAAVQGG